MLHDLQGREPLISQHCAQAIQLPHAATNSRGPCPTLAFGSMDMNGMHGFDGADTLGLTAQVAELLKYMRQMPSWPSGHTAVRHHLDC